MDALTKENLEQAIKANNLILFVGAGFSMPFGLPSWKELILNICMQLKEMYGEKHLPLEWMINQLNNRESPVALEQHLNLIESGGEEICERAKGMLHDIIDQVDPRKYSLDRHDKLWKISKRIITTNYDQLLELKKPDYTKVFSNNNPFQLKRSFEKGSTFLYKIHGDYLNPDTCIFFHKDYERLYSADNANRKAFSKLLSGKKFLFIGFSLDDAYVSNTLDALLQLFGEFSEKHYWVSTYQDKVMEKRYNIQTILVKNYNEDFDQLLDELISLAPQQSLELDPDKDSDYYFEKGLTEQNNSHHEKAIEYYNKAIEMNPGYHISWYNRGLAYHNLEKYDEAVSDYEKCLEIDPKYISALNNIGVAMKKLDKLDEAIKNYEKALEINPDYDRAWQNIGEVLLSQKKYREALSYFEKAIDINPDYELAYFNKGFVLHELGKYEEAVKAYLRSADLNPNQENTWYNIGLSYLQLGDNEQELKAYDNSLKINPNYGKSMVKRADLLLKMDKKQEAIDAYNDVLQLYPADHVSYFNKGTILFELENYEEALKNFDKTVGINADYDAAWYYKAMHAIKVDNNVEKAVPYLKKAISLNINTIELVENNPIFNELITTQEYLSIVEVHKNKG